MRGRALMKKLSSRRLFTMQYRELFWLVLSMMFTMTSRRPSKTRSVKEAETAGWRMSRMGLWSSSYLKVRRDSYFSQK